MGMDTTGGFARLIEHAADYAVFTTDREGRVQEWNTGAERLHGYAAEEIRGTSCDILFVEEDREAGIPELERALALRSGLAENERWHIRKDGRRFWGAGQMLAMHGPDGGHLGFGKIMRDFTRRRELEARHIEAQRMEGVGVLAGGLAHLFNNLLTANLGNVEMMLRLPEVRQHPVAQRHAQEALKAGQRMVELTAQVLTYSGKARSFLQPLDLEKEVRETLASLAPQIPRHIDTRIDIGAACAPITGDATLIRQLVAALVTNAVEAMGEQQGQGSITITCSPYDLATGDAERYRGFDLLPGRYIRLEVTDTGPGLPPAAQARAFDPFYSTKFQGRGLGLAAALGIVRMHGGAIAVRGERGRGATFEVLLPVHDAVPAARSGGQADVARHAPEGSTALVVDDEELVRSLIVRFLETEGFTAIQAENGRQALRITERLGSRIAVVLLDLAMPEMDGAETLPLLRSRLPEVPVVLMTGLTSAEVKVGPDALDADARIHKPFTFDQLTTTVHRVLVSRQRGDEVSRTTS